MFYKFLKEVLIRVNSLKFIKFPFVSLVFGIFSKCNKVKLLSF